MPRPLPLRIRIRIWGRGEKGKGTLMHYNDLSECVMVPIKPVTRHVFTIIAFRARVNNQQADITIPQLEAQTGLNKRSIQRAIKELEEEGLITAARGSGRGSYSVFQVHMNRVQELIPDPFENMLNHLPKGDTQSPLEAETKGDTQSPLKTKGDTQSLKGDTQSLKGDTQSPLNKEKKKKGARARTHARERRPARTAPKGAGQSYDGKKGAAVNRGYATGRDLHLQGGVKIRVNWSKHLEAETIKAWQDACRTLASETGTDVYRSWFGKTVFAGLLDRTVILRAESAFIASHIKREFTGTLLSVLKRLFGDDIQLKIEKETNL